MTLRLFELLDALIAEARQRYELHVLLDDLARDPRRLKDIGLTFREIETRLRHAQTWTSPLRSYWRQRRDEADEDREIARDQPLPCPSSK